MNYENEKKQQISFCGSYCHTCDWHTGRIRRAFRTALDMLDAYGFRKPLEYEVDIGNLRRGLEIVANTGICSGCKAEIAEKRADDRCDIRQCCFSKNFDLCNECSDFACAKLVSNPGVIKFGCIENLREIEEIGLAAWIDKQWEEFVRTRVEV